MNKLFCGHEVQYFKSREKTTPRSISVFGGKRKYMLIEGVRSPGLKLCTIKAVWKESSFLIEPAKEREINSGDVDERKIEEPIWIL